MRLFALLLLPSLALAQTGAIVQPPVPSRGVTLPPTGAALVDEATALSLNPAGLGYLGGSQLFYLHERNLARDGVGDGVFLATRFLGLGAGASMEWIRGRAEPDYRRTSLGLSLGSRTLQLGGAWHDFSSDDGDIDDLSSFDLGLTARPARALSLAAVVRDINAPDEGDVELKRKYNLGLGVRPLDERYTLGVDWLFSEGDFRRGQATYTLNAEVIPGLRLGAGVSHGFTEGVPLALQLGLTVDTSNVGLTYAAGGAEDGTDHVVALRLSSESYRALRPPGGVVTMLDLNDMLAGGTSPLLTLLGARDTDPYLRLSRWLDLAAKDERLSGVLLKMEGLPGVDWGKAEELRQAVLKLRASGKRVMAVLLSADDRGYFVASAADRVYAVPEAMLPINGLTAHLQTLGGTMQKLGVHWDVARVGQYKAATEQVASTEPSEPWRESVNAYLDAQVAWYEKGVAASRKQPPERLRELWATGLANAKQAHALGFLDGVILPTELDAKVRELVPGGRFSTTYAPRDEREGRWGSRRRIAVVPVIGTISGGRSREDPLGFSQIAGAETVIRALERARDDASVVAIVVRVDSGGGDVLASHLMYQAVLEAAQHKPVIASMGDFAASGGYYAAMGAHEVLALAPTITGSIGVYYIKPALQGLLGEKLGVYQESLTRAPLADMFDTWRPWTPEEQAAAQAWADASYDLFITEVAARRKLDKAKVDAVARGRVWSGQDALARGLVDRLGGLQDAVEAARTRAGVPADEDLDVVVMGEARGFFSGLGGEPGVRAALALLPEPPPAIPEPLRALARGAGLDLERLRPGMKAMMPFTLTVE
ncbi:signal peptide peptidase SppA [Myxococcus sp. RHSTA-1-4]|uniref:signal peptide peptidase SppA n=1 Tax=Myxococcus sp. RHSTA-1-4 TaxID=2874601 RepID=UPI001CBDC3B2|nr:signal peptide peptidase SppA [Myxococcus sp. RHSTA-1-4]MBZ4417142.1 signal peptide peptidase SppA [Myxococcus sp. RHSTA-1-4]